MNKKIIVIFLILAVLIFGGWWFVKDYLAVGSNDFSSFNINDDSNNEDFKQKISPSTVSGNAQIVNYKTESVAQGLQVPWSLVFTSKNRILVTERPGRIRVIENGNLLPQPIRTFTVSNQSEEGLMGMTTDPDYDKNKYIYLCMAYGESEPIFDKVMRVTDKGSELSDDLVIIDKIPAAEFHAGCRLRFGPDSKLYVSTGDARQKERAQDLDFLGGKILRLNADGTIPADNPTAGSPVYSYGHRNPQGFDWHPVTGMLVATEHGPSGNDGPGGGDELNIIKSNQNYGWPEISHQKTKAGMISPLLEWTPAIAPASGMFYKGLVFPQFTNNYFFGMLRGTGIVRVVFDEQSPEKVLKTEKLPDVNVGRVRDIVEGPDGFIYFTTSNKDGRGKANDGDDHIFRLVPE
ncbi:sorbosone dehydrogenase family protein [Patescibacteria group bacterium]|nr:sorbosone dehydrogenase family protein [Patescibacteria group bacterium]